jgi:hypothetical protein
VEEFCKHWSKYDPDATGLILIKDLDDLILGLVKQEIDILNHRIVQKQQREESILFNFHQNKYLAKYFAWKKQKDDESSEYLEIYKNK